MARGSIKSRSRGSWTLRVELEPDLVTGKRRQKAFTFHGKKADAQVELAKLVLAADAGRIGAAGDLTVAAYLERWLAEHARAHLAPKTYANYEQLVRNQITPVLGRVMLEKLKPAHVLRLKATLREMSAKAGSRGKPTRDAGRLLSPVRQRQAFRVLYTALGHAVTWRLLAANPAASIPAPSARVGEMRVWSQPQATAFMRASHAQGVAWEAFFVLALSTGMRLAELVGLRWADVDLERRTVRVAQTVSYVEGAGWVTKPPKTAAGQRTMPIDPDLVALLRRHRAAQNAHRLTMGERWADNDLVFPSGLGTPVQAYIVRKVLARICAVAEVAGEDGPEPLPLIRVHDLRHTAATLMLANGVPVKVVSERLGHASVAITMTTYAHVLPGMQEEAALTLARVLRGAAGE